MARVWPFKSKTKEKRVTAQALLDKWFHVRVPEGHASLAAFEAGMTEQEKERMPDTLAKLAVEGVERVYQVRRVELDPDRTTLEYLDELLDAEMRWKLTQDQDATHPRNLFRLVATEFGCMVGEVWIQAGKAQWEPQRAPNHWRSQLKLADGSTYDPFHAVVKKMSDEREPNALTARFDAAES